MSTFNPAFMGAANQTQSNFTEQMALNQLDTESQVRVGFVATSKFVPRSTRLTVIGYGTRIPAYGAMAARYFVPGTQLVGATNAGNLNVRTGNLDDRLVSDYFVDEYDAQQRSTIESMPARNRALGVAIAQMDEIQAAIMAILAARAPATVTGGPVGGAIPAQGSGSSATALLSAIWAAKTQMDLNNIPEEGRYFALNPARYNLLISQMGLLSDRSLGNNGSMVSPVSLPMIAGFEIISSNHMPNTNVSGVTGQRNTYSGNFQQTVGIAFHREAFATLIPASELSLGGKENGGLTSNAQPASPTPIRLIEIPQNLGFLRMSTLITGHCVVRPEAAIEVTDPLL